MRLGVIFCLLTCWFAGAAMAQDSWVTFTRKAQGGPVSVLVDLAVRRDMAQLASGYEITMEVALSEPDAGGMTKPGEAEILSKLEDALVADLAAIGGRFIGRTTVHRARIFHFVFPNSALPGRAEADMAQLARQFGYNARLRREDRSPLAAYENVLYPDAGGWRQINDMRVILALRQAGDQNSAPRQITHWCVFTDQDKAGRFQGWADGVGYLEPAVMRGEGLWMVRFSHEGTVLPNDISGHSVPLDETCRASGGEYDGWESLVVRQD